MDPTARRRLDMLMAWRDGVRAARQSPVPSEEHLRAVAASPQDWPAAARAELEPWRPALEWLLKQLRLGVSDPLNHLPDALRSPVAAAPAATTGPAAAPEAPRAPAAPVTAPQAPSSSPRGGESPALEALRDWRDRGIARNAPGFASVKDSHLKSILASGSRSSEAIAKMLPDAAVRALSGEVVRLLAASGGGDSTRSAAGRSHASDATAARAGTPAAAPSAPSVPSVQPGRTAPEATPAAADGRSPLVSGPAGSAASGHGTDLPPTSAQGASEDEAGIDPTAFDPFDLALPSGEPGPLSVMASLEGGVTMSWGDAEAHGFTVYRAVSGDEYAPYSPESADLVAVTRQRRILDARPFQSAVRHYQVWRNTGSTRDAAVRSQPSLHAAAAVVGPVLDLDVRADGGRVIGQWRVLPGVEHVQVYRIPLEKAPRAGLAPEYRIVAGEENLGGFIDEGVVRGARYLYKICAAARVDGVVRLSVASPVEVAVSAVLSPVADLRVAPRGQGDSDGRAFDLTWTNPPAGRVVIYRTPQPPRAGAATEARPVSALPQMQLEDKDRLAHPIRAAEDGRSMMRDVPWPDGWTRAYFTPVTTLDGTARVGMSTSATWVPPVLVPRIVERVDRQVLTFAWPTGAASVVAHVGPRGVGAEAARGGRQCEISQAQYRDLGGLAFPFVLPADGCSVHVVPVAFAAGERVEGPAVSVEYPGLVRLRYRTSMKRGLTGKPVALLVDIISGVPIEPPPFVLVHNAERLPLDVADGTALEATREGDDTMAVTRRPCPDRLVPDEPSRWRFDTKGLQGYVRLFVDLPPSRLRRVALMDPPVRELRLEPLFGGRG